jgi:hypothetical protein
MDLAQPLEDDDATTKGYVDNAVVAVGGTATLLVNSAMSAHLLTYAHGIIVLPTRFLSDALAANTWERLIFAVPVGHAYTITKISICPLTGFGQNTNYATLEVDRIRSGSADVIVTKIYNAANAVAAYVNTSLGNLNANNKLLIAGDVVSILKSNTADGQIVPEHIITLELIRTA